MKIDRVKNTNPPLSRNKKWAEEKYKARLIKLDFNNSSIEFSSCYILGLLMRTVPSVYTFGLPNDGQKI